MSIDGIMFVYALLVSVLVGVKLQETSPAGAVDGESIVPLLQALSSVLLVLVTLGYVYLTYQLVKQNQQLVKQNQEQVEELRRERNRPYVFDMLFEGVFPLQEQLEDHKEYIDDLFDEGAERPAFPEIEGTLTLPPDHIWSDLMSKYPSLPNLLSEVKDRQDDYAEQRTELLEDITRVLHSCVDLYTWTVETMSEETLRDMAKDYVARSGQDVTEENISSSMEYYQEQANANPSQDEFAEELSNQAELDEETAKAVYEWLELGDVAGQIWYEFAGKHGDGSKEEELADKILARQTSGSFSINPVTYDDLFEFHWIVFPEESAELKERLEKYHDAVETFLRKVEQAKTEYTDQYGISDTELEHKEAKRDYSNDR